MKAELVPENGDPPIPILRDLTLLGRHEDCDIVIDHPSLSKRHCLLVKTDGLLVIRDLATTNGTKVKGQRVRWAALLPEDRVSFGAYKMRIYLGSDEMPSPSEVRQGRSRGGPRPAGDEVRGLPRFSSSANTELSAPSRAPRMVMPSFPEPSEPEMDSHSVDEPLPVAPAAEPAGAFGGFELLDDSSSVIEDKPDPVSAGGGVFEGGFELIDDDDDIIELE